MPNHRRAVCQHPQEHGSRDSSREDKRLEGRTQAREVLERCSAKLRGDLLQVKDSDLKELKTDLTAKRKALTGVRRGPRLYPPIGP